MALAAAFLWPALHCAAVIADGVRDELGSADLILILGSKVFPSGRPSPRLCRRLDRGLELYREGRAPTILVSGGLGIEGWKEGDVMAAYLIERGVPASAVVIDNGGDNTFLSARHTRDHLLKTGGRSALVVTDYFHIPRARLALHRFGVAEVYSAKAELWIGRRDPYWIARDFVAFYYYLVRSYRA